MELSCQMLLLTAVNYGSYYLHITKEKKSMFNIVVCLVGFSALSERNDYHGLSLAGV